MHKILLFACLSLISTFSWAQPLDDITARTILQERKVLAYPPIREADIFWEKRIWRVIDVREKMNQTFSYPEDPFFWILGKAALEEKITVYSPEDDKFTYPLSGKELQNIFSKSDTVEVFNPTTYDPEIKIVTNDIDWEDIKRYRIKEVWYFDSNTSTLKVRILGIAPLIEVFDDDTGIFRYERPLFWAYYPEIRETLARHEVFNPSNDANVISWEDLMEMRYFSSLIYKESNIHDRKLESYLSGVDMLLESEKIKQEIFNFEHDLWSY